jgi:4-alpha-glucanotransferase
MLGSDHLLADVAAAHGVATEYWDQAGQQVQVEPETIHRVLAALGLDTSTPQACEQALHDARLREWRRMLPPVFVSVQGQTRRCWVHVPHGQPVQAWVELEDGGRWDLAQMEWWVDPREVDGVLIGEASFAIPPDLPCGWHRLFARSQDKEESIFLIMTPDRLNPDAIVGERQWGFMAQMYATQSRQSWGLGDISDCVQLGVWSAEHAGAGFILVNPLHAGEPQPPLTPSPYLPVTRRFAHPIYLSVPEVPGYESLPKKVRKRLATQVCELNEAGRSADVLDRDGVWRVKRKALAALFDVPHSKSEEKAFTRFREREGQGLLDYATWAVLSEKYGNETSAWPKKFRHPRNSAVTKFRRTHVKSIRFHEWLQWKLDQQLAHAQTTVREAGMAVGFLHDLAVGVHPEGADAWALQDVLAAGVSVGAPPDMYNQMGQNWSQPPWRPDALAEAAFIPYRDMLRTVLRNSGGLRIDHVLGLFRMWWIPEGMSANAGTYVTFDFDAMVGILCLEAQRAGAIVIGEDLGTVEPWVQHVLAERGILGTVILWFEAWDSGEPKPPEFWRGEVLASVTVHDLPPTAGYLRGEHVRIRHELDLLTGSVEEERMAAESERAAWAQLLRERGLLPWDTNLDTDEGLAQFVIALHRAVASSPARLVGVSVPDIFGDQRAQNQPGTDREYPNWCVPMTDALGRHMTIEDLFENPSIVAPFAEALGRTVQP